MRWLFLMLAAAFLAPAAPPIRERPDGALVWEAEWANTVSGSWAPLPAPDCGAGAILWAREGSGRDNRADESPYRLGQAIYGFTIDRPGVYRLWMRLRAEDGCGDSCFAAFDGKPLLRYPSHVKEHYPLTDADYGNWVWVQDTSRHDRFEAGPHTLAVNVREDGFAIDQIALIPVDGLAPGGPRPLIPSCLPTLTAAGQARNPLSVQLVSTSYLIEPGEPATALVWVRVNGPLPAGLAGTVSLSGAAVSVTPELSDALPVSFTQVTLTVPPLARHSASLRLELGGHSLAVSVLRPYPWRVSRLLTPAELPALASAVPAWGLAAAPLPDLDWRRIEPAHYRWMGTIDLAAAHTGQPVDTACWLAADIDVDTAGDYILLAGGDDTLHLYLDGVPVFADENHKPLTDTLAWKRIALGAGRHRLAALATQASGNWLVHLEWRGSDRTPTAAIRGVDPLP